MRLYFLIVCVWMTATVAAAQEESAPPLEQTREELQEVLDPQVNRVLELYQFIESNSFCPRTRIHMERVEGRTAVVRVCGEEHYYQVDGDSFSEVTRSDNESQTTATAQDSETETLRFRSNRTTWGIGLAILILSRSVGIGISIGMASGSAWAASLGTVPLAGPFISWWSRGGGVDWQLGSAIAGGILQVISLILIINGSQRVVPVNSTPEIALGPNGIYGFF